MRVWGIDFTSAPSRRKPIRVAACRLAGDRLALEGMEGLTDFAALEAFLRRPGPWIAGFDLPFAQPRRFLEGAGWPLDWAAYVRHADALGPDGFRAALVAYRAPRAPGDKEHARVGERGTGAVSPQKLGNPPVALMFRAGAPRLLAAGVSIPGLRAGDPARVAVEAYPGVLARRLIGRRSYKGEDRAARDDPARARARADLWAALTGEAGRDDLGLVVEAPPSVAEDPAGDVIDALLCATQAAWARGALASGRIVLAAVDPLEGWMADPSLHPARAPDRPGARGGAGTFEACP